MDHGVTASTSLQVSRRAAFSRKMTSQSIQDVGELVQSYKQEVDGYNLRIKRLEAAEVERLAKEAAYREELWNNHGKPKSYFKAPKFALAVRSNSRRIKKMQEKNAEDRNELKLMNEQRIQKRSTSRFALDDSHYQLKAMVTKREQELKEVLNSHQATVKDYLDNKPRLQTQDSFKTDQSDKVEDSELVKKLVKVGSVEEIQLDLSFVKA